MPPALNAVGACAAPPRAETPGAELSSCWSDPDRAVKDLQSGSTISSLTLCDGHSPLSTTPRADKTFGSGGNAEDHGERSIPRRAACIATCVGFILIPFSFALNP